MATVIKKEVKQVEVERQVRVSDFSGREIPKHLHWSTVTNIECYTSDHGSLNGNQCSVFKLDLTPREMEEFVAELNKLVDAMKLKHLGQYETEKLLGSDK